MECYGFDIHSPYLFASGAGFFIGVALGLFIRTLISRGKLRSRRAAGVYLSLSAFFTVILLSLFLIDIPSLEYSNALAAAGGLSALCGAAAAVWKRTAGGALLVLLVAFITLFSFYARQWDCAEDGETVMRLRVLTVEESRMEVEAVGYGEESKENLRIKSLEGGPEITIGYRRTEFPEWFFFSKNRYLYRIEDIGGSAETVPGSEENVPRSEETEPENGSITQKRSVSFLERIIESLPFVYVSHRVVSITEPAEFSSYSIVAARGELTVITSSE